MSKYQLTPPATSDLLEIWNFIAEDNPTAADEVAEAIFHGCQLLADLPHAGRFREDLTLLPVRFWLVRPYSNYLIVYRSETKPLQIIRILHAARDIGSILR